MTVANKIQYMHQQKNRKVLYYHIPYSGYLSKEKTFSNFVVSRVTAKVFSMKYWERGIVYWEEGGVA